MDIGDFSVLAARFNLLGTFSQGDFNYDHIADIGDFSILASKFNTILPAAPAPQFPATTLAAPPEDRQASSTFSGRLIDDFDLAGGFEVV